jgi:DNA-binding MarR family transcriptional regulator
MVELLFFAYRDFTSEPDLVLAELGFGRVHHRVLHFVNRHPGLRVADLLDVLRITKQSLARVLKQLVDEGYVRQERPETDRRERRLQVTDKGRRLAERLLALQAQRLGQALSLAGPDAGKVAERFLSAVVSPANREQVARLVSGDVCLTSVADGGGQ